MASVSLYSTFQDRVKAVLTKDKNASCAFVVAIVPSAPSPISSALSSSISTPSYPPSASPSFLSPTSAYTPNTTSPSKDPLKPVSKCHCRPDCAMIPLTTQPCDFVFFNSSEEALSHNFKPCLECHPDLPVRIDTSLVKSTVNAVNASLNIGIRAKGGAESSSSDNTTKNMTSSNASPNSFDRYEASAISSTLGSPTIASKQIDQNYLLDPNQDPSNSTCDNAPNHNHHRRAPSLANSPDTDDSEFWTSRPRRASIANGHIHAVAVAVDEYAKMEGNDNPSFNIELLDEPQGASGASMSASSVGNGTDDVIMTGSERSERPDHFERPGRFGRPERPERSGRRPRPGFDRPERPDSVRTNPRTARQSGYAARRKDERQTRGEGEHARLVGEACMHIAAAAAAAAAQAVSEETAELHKRSPSSIQSSSLQSPSFQAPSYQPPSNLQPPPNVSAPFQPASMVRSSSVVRSASLARSASVDPSRRGFKIQRKKRRGGILGFKELAAKAGLSPWHFHRVFRSVTGLTPKAYGDACWDTVTSLATEDLIENDDNGEVGGHHNGRSGGDNRGRWDNYNRGRVGDYDENRAGIKQTSLSPLQNTQQRHDSLGQQSPFSSTPVAASTPASEPGSQKSIKTRAHNQHPNQTQPPYQIQNSIQNKNQAQNNQNQVIFGRLKHSETSSLPTSSTQFEFIGSSTKNHSSSSSSVRSRAADVNSFPVNVENGINCQTNHQAHQQVSHQTGCNTITHPDQIPATRPEHIPVTRLEHIPVTHREHAPATMPQSSISFDPFQAWPEGFDLDLLPDMPNMDGIEDMPSIEGIENLDSIGNIPNVPELPESLVSTLEPSMFMMNISSSNSNSRIDLSSNMSSNMASTVSSTISPNMGSNLSPENENLMLSKHRGVGVGGGNGNTGAVASQGGYIQDFGPADLNSNTNLDLETTGLGPNLGIGQHNVHSIDHIQNMQDMQALEHFQSVQNMQHMDFQDFQNMQSMQNLQNMPNFHNIQNIQNVQNIQSLQNIQNMQPMSAELHMLNHEHKPHGLPLTNDQYANNNQHVSEAVFNVPEMNNFISQQQQHQQHVQHQHQQSQQVHQPVNQQQLSGLATTIHDPHNNNNNNNIINAKTITSLQKLNAKPDLASEIVLMDNLMTGPVGMSLFGPGPGVSVESSSSAAAGTSDPLVQNSHLQDPLMNNCPGIEGPTMVPVHSFNSLHSLPIHSNMSAHHPTHPINPAHASHPAHPTHPNYQTNPNHLNHPVNPSQSIMDDQVMNYY